MRRMDSFGLDARIVDHLAPHLDLFLDPREELLGRAAGWRQALALQVLLHFLRPQGKSHVAADAVHDRARQSFGTGEAVPDDDFVTRHAGLSDGRNLRSSRDAPGSRYGDRA